MKQQIKDNSIPSALPSNGDEKFTGGEWYAKEGQIYPLETGKTLALIPYFDEHNEEQKANAALISAAPDMYKALKEVVADLFYQLEGKHGAEKAANYPSIIFAKSILQKANPQ